MTIECLKPQKGQQTKYLKSSADIAFYGGSAGGGKTYASLLEPLYHIHVPNFGATIFRRTSPMIRTQGGLWDTSIDIYSNPKFRAHSRESVLEWIFPNQVKIKFAHLQRETDVLSYQSAQIPLIIFDELTHFTEYQFEYMFSRNRSACGVKPYIRGTTNPDSQSWVKKWIEWYLDPETGLAIPERSGVIRWFIKHNDKRIWANSKQELLEKYPECLPKSFTFINASVFDNKILLEVDPNYLANLNALPRVERERLLNGNWNVRPSSGLYFKKYYFELVNAVPARTKKIRYWDRASTRKTDTNDPDYTVGVLLEKDIDNILYVTDVIRVQESPLKVQTIIKNTAIKDGINVQIGIEEDVGQAGVADAEYLTRLLQGFRVKRNRVMKDKVTRASPVSAQAEAGNIKIKVSNWNDDFFSELENFPDGNHDDIVDALSGAFYLINESAYSLASLAR